MSPQQLFALCLVASAVVAVSSQGIDPQACAQRARQHIDEFRNTAVSAMQKWSNSMQDTGSQAVDISSIQGEIDKISESLSSVTDMSQGMDMGRYTSLYMENIERMSTIVRKLFRANLLTAPMESNFEMASTMMSSYMGVIQKISASCMPRKRVQPAL